MTTSDLTNELIAAAAKAQLDLKPAKKDATNPHFGSRYADLAAVIEAASVYARHGIAIFQDVVTVPGVGVAVSTRLAHISGQWIEFGPLTVPVSKQDAHGVGSATTYGKRYGLQAAALIPSEDDDGTGAVETLPPPPVRSARPVRVPPPEPKILDGYDEWLADLEAAADNGVAILKETWEHSKPEFRKYLTTHANPTWEALKRRAALAEVPNHAS